MPILFHSIRHWRGKLTHVGTAFAVCQYPLLGVLAGSAITRTLAARSYVSCGIAILVTWYIDISMLSELDSYVRNFTRAMS